MNVGKDLQNKIRANLDTLDDAIKSVTDKTKLSQAWIESFWPTAQQVPARRLLVGAKIALLESATCWGIGANRGAAASLRTFIENSLGWIYYKDHPIEYGVVEKQKEELYLPKQVRSYIQNIDPGFQEAGGLLAKHLTRTDDYFYSTVSAYVHAHPSFANFSSTIVDSIISSPRDAGFLRLCEYSDEFISDTFACYARRNWSGIPKIVQDNLRQRLEAKLPKFLSS